jgi:hypothetical protein
VSLIRLDDQLTGGDRDDARLRLTEQRRTDNRALPDEQYQRGCARLESGKARYRIVLDADF